MAKTMQCHINLANNKKD